MLTSGNLSLQAVWFIYSFITLYNTLIVFAYHKLDVCGKSFEEQMEQPEKENRWIDGLGDYWATDWETDGDG